MRAPGACPGPDRRAVPRGATRSSHHGFRTRKALGSSGQPARGEAEPRSPRPGLAASPAAARGARASGTAPGGPGSQQLGEGDVGASVEATAPVLPAAAPSPWPFCASASACGARAPLPTPGLGSLTCRLAGRTGCGRAHGGPGACVALSSPRAAATRGWDPLLADPASLLIAVSHERSGGLRGGRLSAPPPPPAPARPSANQGVLGFRPEPSPKGTVEWLTQQTRR